MPAKLTTHSKTVKKRHSNFKPEFYLQAYELARAGVPERGIAKQLNVKYLAFVAWKRDKPAFRDAIIKGQKEHNDQDPLFVIEQLSNKNQQMFLKAYIHEGTIWHAARLAGVSPQSHWHWNRTDELYRKAWEFAQDAHRDTLVKAATERARDGLRQYKFHKGNHIMVACHASHPEAVKMVDKETGQVVYKRPWYDLKHSDALMIKLLEARVPEFKPQAQQTNVNVSQAVVLQDLLEEVEQGKDLVIDSDYVKKAAEAFIEAQPVQGDE